ncbi:hypothetical protein V490_00057 [Pseudogymnoascus sp. VKM F-3557]|nr:hypothetical protein V490_00057 [Pseudogymnoascus sp. VKM F-3557]
MADSKVSKERTLYRVPKSISTVPNEFWDAVRSHLPYFSSHALRRVLDYTPSAKDDHSRIWNYFFKSDDWLNAAYNKGVNPCLVGYDLYPLLYDKDGAFNVTDKETIGKGPKRIYLAIVYGRDQDGPALDALKTKEMIDLFHQSLWPFKSIGAMCHDLKFANGAILNDSNITQGDPYINVSSPRQLVSRKLDGLHSAYLYWKDEPRVCGIKPKDVFGIEKGLTKKNVSNIVGFNWKNLPSGIEQQHVFAIPGMVLQTEEIVNSEKITGFKWRKRWTVYSTLKGTRSNRLASVKKEEAEWEAKRKANKEREEREEREAEREAEEKLRALEKATADIKLKRANPIYGNYFR